MTTLQALLLPPGIFLLLLALGLFQLFRDGRGARALLVVGVAGLYLASTTAVSTHLMAAVQSQSSPLAPSADDADAIIVLAAGRRYHAPEYGGGGTVSAVTLERLRYAARLHRRTGLPVAAVGGDPEHRGTPDADLMAAALRTDFGVDEVWRERLSRNTWENAQFTRTLLAAHEARRVYLVTHAWHMPRALQAFRAAEVDVVPAPTAFVRAVSGPGAWIPRASGLVRSKWALHELLGRAWYALRY